MVIPSIPDFPQVPVLRPEALNGTSAAVLTTDPSEETTLALLAQHMGPSLLLDEYWSLHFPRCGVLISSAICGGSLAERFREAAAAFPRRCWLLLEPIRMEFPLPCPDGTGRPVKAPPDRNGIFSEPLCCQYAHFLRDDRGFFVLWDTEQTLKQKMLLAKEAGFLGFAYGAFDRSGTM